MDWKMEWTMDFSPTAEVTISTLSDLRKVSFIATRYGTYRTHLLKLIKYARDLTPLRLSSSQ